jgi:hypothetical protein
MTTASISHRPIAGTAVAAAFVAAIAFAGVSLAQHDSGSPAPASAPTSPVQLPNPDALYQRPLHTGVQVGMP